jgi:hypothetical protein
VAVSQEAYKVVGPVDDFDSTIVRHDSPATARRLPTLEDANDVESLLLRECIDSDSTGRSCSDYGDSFVTGGTHGDCR